jgi:aminoglycoside phosphotransferase (APT) family kinase protein
MSDAADLSDRLSSLMRARIEGLTRLSGGASRETWSFDSVDPRSGARKELILRRDPPGAPRDGMELEARLLGAAARAGMPVPGVRAAGPAAADRLVTSYLIMDRVAGETIARKILRDGEFSIARAGLAAQCGAALAKLHSVDPATIPGLETFDPVARYKHTYEMLAEQLQHRAPVFEWAFDWLEANRPTNAPSVVVHGDFRLGNLIVSSVGLTSVLDWELAHVGDPMEDLGWLCVKAWRFGATPEVGGFGSVDELVAGYESAGGEADRDRLRWWIVAGTLIWGVMCMVQANAHVSGAIRSVELAAIGRRVPEQEHDLLLLLAPVELELAKRAYETRGAPQDCGDTLADPFGPPSAMVLVEAVRDFLQNDVMTGTSGRLQFQSRVASNVLSMVLRQLRAEPQVVGSAVGLSAVGLAGMDLAEMASAVVTRLAVANPKYLT